MEKATNSKVGRYVVLCICALALAGAGSFDGQPTPRGFALPTPGAQQAPLSREVGSTVPSPADSAAPQEPLEFEPYTESIPGTVVTFNMIPVPGGAVTIADPDAPGGERVVDVAPFWIGQTEVTWDEYDVFQLGLDVEPMQRAGIDAESRPSKPYGAPDWGFGHFGFATLSVTYQAVTRYAEWLSELTGKGYRLPTLPEWQHACRLGVGEAEIDPDYLEEHAWYAETTDRATAPVAVKQADQLGLFDMLGNAGEWVTNPDGNPALHGGTFRDAASEIHCATRVEQRPSWNSTDPQFPKSSWWLSDGMFVGFRLARDGNR